MPQEQSCAGVMSSINGNEDIYIRMETKYLGRTALWVVLRLGRMGGTFSSSSRKCHRPIKAPFLSFSFFFFFCDYGAKWTSPCQEVWISIFWSLPFRCVRIWLPEPSPKCTPGWALILRETFSLPLLFCTPLCYCEVWSVYSDSVVLLQDCVGEGRVLSLDDRHL